MSNNKNGSNSNGSKQQQQQTVINSVADLFNAAGAEADKRIANKTAKKSERAIVVKRKNAEINKVNVTKDIALKAAGENELLKFDINQHADREIKEITLRYQPELDALNKYQVDITEAGAEELANKVTAKVAPATRAVSSFTKTAFGNLFGKKAK